MINQFFIVLISKKCFFVVIVVVVVKSTTLEHGRRDLIRVQIVFPGHAVFPAGQCAAQGDVRTSVIEQEVDEL